MAAKKRYAFTLIEVLTVIAIIGILAAILIPVAASIRDSARSAKCVSNLRSTGTAMLSHINEYDGVLTTFRGGSETHRIWPQTLRNEGYWEFRTNHYHNESIVCPSWDYRERGHHFDAYGLNMFDPDGTTDNPSQSGEGPNANIYTRNFNDTHINPTRYILLADSYRATNGLQVFRLLSNDSHPNGSIHLRHNDRANIFFLDGHVASHGVDTLGELEPPMAGGYDSNENEIQFPQP